MTNSTSKTQISVDMPNLASCEVRFTLTGLGVNAVDEVFPSQLETTTTTLDSAGEDDGALYLTTPDATGTSSYAWLVEARPANTDKWTTVGSIAVAYSASAQELGALLEASDSAIAATQTGITVAESTWLTAEIAATGATADGNLLQSDGTNSEDSGLVASTVYYSGGTDVAVTDGGTGASTAAAARTNLDALPIDAGIASISSGQDLAAGDNGKILELNGTFSLNCPNGLDTGYQVALNNVGTGTITITATTTLRSKGSAVTIDTQYAMATLYHSGSNIWYLAGDIA